MGFLITSTKTDNYWTPGLFWNTANDQPTKPKAGIYMKITGSGSHIYFGTSNAYGTGLTNDAMVIDHSGNIGIGTTAPANAIDVRRSTAAGRTNMDFTNGASVASGNKLRIRLGAFSGFVGSDLHPYIESIVENAGTGATGVALGTYDGVSASNEVMRISGLTQNVGIGVTTPLAVLHLRAGTATASTSPLKFTSGTKLTTAEAGVHEYNGNHLLSNSSVRFPVGGTLFQHFADAGNTTTSETDLVTDTTAASTLAVNGDQIEGDYGGVFVSSGTATRQIKLYFGGTAIFDTGALTLSLSSGWNLYAMVMRVSSTVVRYTVSFTTQGAALAAYTASGELTGLTLSNTNVMKITGTAAGVGAATNDIVAKLGTLSFRPAA